MPTPRLFARGLTAAALAALAAGAPAASAQIVQTTSIPFLQIEPDSRTSGMGMAGGALADDVNAIFWNPAGLAGLEGYQLSITHAPWLPELGADLSYEFGAASANFEGIGTAALHVTYLNLGEQTRVTDDGQEIGTFRSGDLAVGVGFGRRVLPNVDVGLGLRYISSNLAGGVIAAGNTVVGDVGVLYRPPSFSGFEPTVGVTLANLGTSISYGDESQPNAIPSYIRIGGAVTKRFDEFNRMSLAIDLKRLIVDEDSSGSPAPFYQGLFTSWGGRTVDPTPNDEFDCSDPQDDCENVGVLRQFTVGLGAEYWYNDLLALRTGSS